jgi:hypothetical protein
LSRAELGVGARLLNELSRAGSLINEYLQVESSWLDICGAPIYGTPRILIYGAPKRSAPQIMGPWIRVFLVVLSWLSLPI